MTCLKDKKTNIKTKKQQAEKNVCTADRQIDFTLTKPDRDWVMDHLMEITNRCMQAVPVNKTAQNKTGEGEWKFDAAGAIRALTLLGKDLGMFTDKVQEQESTYEDILDRLK